MSLLPQEKSASIIELSQKSILLYGRSKIGKSVLASDFPDALFVQCEPGISHIEAYKTPLLTSWENVRSLVSELDQAYQSSTPPPYKTIVIDTIDRMAALCVAEVCQKENIEDPSEVGWGKAYRKIANKMESAIYRFAALPAGLILISHSKEIEIDSPTGKYNRTVPNLQSGVLDIVTAFVDYIFFCTIEKDQEGNWVRVIKTKPHPNYEAGERAKEEKQKLPETIPLNYQELKNCFDEAMLPF